MSQTARTCYAVIRDRVGSWNFALSMRQQEQWDEHAAFMDALATDGFVILGGPLGEGKRVLLIIAAEDEQAIEARLADDPWTSLGLLRTTSIEPWEILLRASQ